MLLQEGHATTYESCQLHSNEQSLDIYEKELLAVMHALDTQNHYLLGTPVIIQTDHQSLTSISLPMLLNNVFRIRSAKLERRMARKSMPASRKRPSPTKAEDGEPPPPLPLPQQQQQQHGQQQQQQVEMDVSVHDFSQGQNAIPSPAELPSSAPSRAIRKKRHSHVRTSLFKDDLQNMKKWLNACKRRKEISMLESCNFLSDHVKELCKASNIVSSLQQVNASTEGYGFDHTLQSCAGTFASIIDWARFLSSLRTWMYSMAPIINDEQCASHFINYVQLITEINRSACDKKFFDDPFSFFTPSCLQQEMMECLLSHVEEKKNCCPKVSGHQLALSTLVDAFLGQLGLSGKRKKAWFEDLPKNVSNWLFPRNEGEQTDSMKSNKDYKPRVQSVSCKVTREKPARTAHQISHDELESWIVKHSLPSIQRKQEEFLKILDNGEQIDYDFEDYKKDSFAVWKSKANGQSLEMEHEKTLKLLEKVKSTENEYLKNYRDIKKLLDNDKKTDCDVQQSRKNSNAVSEGGIVGHAMPSTERIYDKASKSLGNAEKREVEFSKDRKDSKIEIEVDLSGKSESLLGFDASAADTPSSRPYLKRIVNAVSLSTLEGVSEAMVLFKALRSDETEVIVDNGYLRSNYPFLLVSFYEQNLRFVSERPSS
ncbi:hypothetical protein L7F22_056619 [Adiantum nelumboides]|nr:hypothetical protein [Adiantum nelumboides]